MRSIGPSSNASCSAIPRHGRRSTCSPGSSGRVVGPRSRRERVTTALAAIRDWVEYVVIDTGFSLEHDEEITSDQFAPRRNAATFAAPRRGRAASSRSASPTRSGLSRLLRGHGELVELVEPERIDVVVNRVRTSALGIDAHAQVRQTLRRFAGLATRPSCPTTAGPTDAAILTARTLRDAAPRSPLRAALREYVARPRSFRCPSNPCDDAPTPSEAHAADRPARR